MRYYTDKLSVRLVVQPSFLAKLFGAKEKECTIELNRHVVVKNENTLSNELEKAFYSLLDEQFGKGMYVVGTVLLLEKFTA